MEEKEYARGRVEKRQGMDEKKGKGGGWRRVVVSRVAEGNNGQGGMSGLLGGFNVKSWLERHQG